MPATEIEPIEAWTKVITPQRRWWDLRLGECWKYRDLIMVFVHRNFTANYKQTILGPLWFFIQPILTTLVFTVVFKNIANLSTDKIPPFLFYFCGVVAWTYFSDCLTKTGGTFNQNAALFGKVYFPRLTVPLSIVITNLMALAIQMALLFVFLLYFWWRGAPIEPNWRILAVPLLIIQMAAIGLGMGCLISALTIRYRDLNMLVGFGVQLWMYGSCVVYPLSSVDSQYRWILACNPMVPVIESFRLAFLGQGIVDRGYLFTGLGVSAVILLAGLMLFNHVEKTFTDTV